MIYKYILHFHVGTMDVKQAGKNKYFYLYKFTHSAVISMFKDLYASSVYYQRHHFIQRFKSIFKKKNTRNISLKFVKNSRSSKGKQEIFNNFDLNKFIQDFYVKITYFGDVEFLVKEKKLSIVLFNYKY